MCLLLCQTVKNRICCLVTVKSALLGAKAKLQNGRSLLCFYFG